jgi:hypothetical protein
MVARINNRWTDNSYCLVVLVLVISRYETKRRIVKAKTITPFERWMATTRDWRLVSTTNIPISISNTIENNAIYAILTYLEWFIINTIVVSAIAIALKIASNLWIFSYKNFSVGIVRPLGHNGHSVHASSSREAVIDLPEIIVLKIKVNDNRIKMKNLPKA